MKNNFLLVFIFFFIFAFADFFITLANIKIDGSNEANLLAREIYKSYGAPGLAFSGIIYGSLILSVFFLIKLPTEPKFGFEKRHYAKILKIKKSAEILALSLIIFGGASHLSAFWTWIYLHYGFVDWLNFVRLTALSAPIAFLIGLKMGK